MPTTAAQQRERRKARRIAILTGPHRCNHCCGEIVYDLTAQIVRWRKYCTERCEHAAWKARFRKANRVHYNTVMGRLKYNDRRQAEIQHRHCEVCGEPFVTNGNTNQKYCTAKCNQKAYRTRRAASLPASTCRAVSHVPQVSPRCMP